VTQLLTSVGAVALVVALAAPAGRRAFMRLVVWPIRDVLRRDWDADQGSKVERRREWIS
jgi:hypothetical protein